jgi:hypothetical protein
MIRSWGRRRACSDWTVLEQTVAGGVAALVVDRLELVDVDEGDDQFPTVAAHPAQITLELQQPGSSQVRPSQLIERGGVSVCSRTLAIVLRVLTVRGRKHAFVAATRAVIQGRVPVVPGGAAIRSRCARGPARQTSVSAGEPTI